MGGPQGVSRDPRADWRFYEQPPPGEAQRKQLPLAPWAKDYEKVGSSSPSIGLLVVAPGGEVAFKPAVVARPEASVEREEAAKHARLVAVVHPERRFSDLKMLTVEIFRLKSEATKSQEPHIAPALKQQLCMLQSQWVGMAKAASIPEPTGRLDALTAKPEDVARAFMWSEAGGVIPRGELEADGGRAFQLSVREAMTLRTQGFDGLLDLHRGRPEMQKPLLYRELTRLGDRAAPRADDTVESLRARRQEIVMGRAAEETHKEMEAARKQLYIGLDGFVGTAESLAIYERNEALQAMNPGTTAGSILATYVGGGDVQKMRALGEVGSAIEGVAGGAGVVVKKIQDAREAPGTRSKSRQGPKTDAKPRIPIPQATVSQNVTIRSAEVSRVDAFNARGTFRTKEMNPRYGADPSTGKLGEHEPGNKIWPGKTVQYCSTSAERARFKIEAREVEVNGVREMRLVAADGRLFDTRSAKTWNAEGRAIFVMSSSGEIFASTYQEAGKFHHSSLAGGQAVAAAGELTVIDGKLVAISNQSGHYMPDESFTDQAIQSFRARGIATSGLRVKDARSGGEHVLP